MTSRKRLTREQQNALVFTVMEGAVGELAAMEEAGQLPEGMSYDECARHIARWLRRLPGNQWHTSLPHVWEEGDDSDR